MSVFQYPVIVFLQSTNSLLYSSCGVREPRQMKTPHQKEPCKPKQKQEDKKLQVEYNCLQEEALTKLENIPPRRRYLKRKSLFPGTDGTQRKLQQDELIGYASTQSYSFWQTLGKTRCIGYDFKWKGKPLGYRSSMGRVYYESFVLNGTEIGVGNIVRFSESEAILKVVSAFQATKSFVGFWPDRKTRAEVQNRGIAYVELVPFYKKKDGNGFVLLASSKWNDDGTHVQGAPLQLFSDDGKKLLKVGHGNLSCEAVFTAELKKNVQKLPATQQLSQEQCELVKELDGLNLALKFALKAWPVYMEVKFKILYTTERRFKLGKHEALTAFQSDDSDEFNNASQLMSITTSTYWSDVTESAGLITSISLERSKSLPQPMVMYDGGPLLCLPSAPNLELHDNFSNLDPLLDNCVNCDSSLSDLIAHFRKEVKLRTRQTRLEECFETAILPGKKRGGRIGKVAKSLNITHYKSKLQQLACQQAASLDDMRDVVTIAPCGSGKSLVFVMAALLHGGVNIVVQPLNAIIMSQMKDLSVHNNVLNIEQLFNEVDAKREHKPRAGDRLQILLNEYQGRQLSEKPFIIFTTPELLESRLSQLEQFSELGLLKNITIDEVDEIEISQTNSRRAYTKLLGKLREHCPSTKFIFLSATVSAVGLVDLLPVAISSNQHPSIQQKPMLFLHDRALADSLSFEVERKCDNEQVKIHLHVL